MSKYSNVKRPLKVVPCMRKYPVIAVISSCTGYVGESSAELTIVYPGEDADKLAYEEAREHAESMGRAGSYYCGNCDSEQSDEVCEDCDVECDWAASEAIEGSAFLFQYYRVGSLHTSVEEISRLLQECGAVGPLVDNREFSFIDMDILPHVIDYDEGEWLEFCADIRAKEDDRLAAIERNKPKIFGVRATPLSFSFGWTLEGLETAAYNSRMSECSMDEALSGGDTASSEAVISDLVKYIYELHDRFNIRKEGHNG